MAIKLLTYTLDYEVPRGYFGAVKKVLALHLNLIHDERSHRGGRGLIGVW